MGMKLCFCKVVFCITEFCCQSSRIFLVLLSFQSSRFFILTASILQFSVLLSFAVKAAGFFSMQQILFVLFSFQSSRQIFRSSKQEAELAGSI